MHQSSGAASAKPPSEIPEVGKAVLFVAGAAFALAAALAFVGGAVLWFRYRGAHLPAADAVAAVDRGELLDVGVKAIALPATIGAVWAASLAGIGQVDGKALPRGLPVAVLGGTLVAGAIYGVLTLIDGSAPGLPHVAVVAIAVVIAFCVGALIAAAFARRSNTSIWHVIPASAWRVAVFMLVLGLLLGLGGLAILDQLHDLGAPGWIVGALVWVLAGAAILAAGLTSGRLVIAGVTLGVCALVGIGLALERMTAAPELQPVAVQLKDGRVIVGFRVASNATEVLVATLPEPPFEAETLDRIEVVPRTLIAKLSRSIATGTDPRSDGRALAIAMGDRFNAKPLPAAPVRTSIPVETFAPLVHLHVKERYWPMAVDTFLDSSILMWAHTDPDCDWSAVDQRHVRRSAAPDPRLLGAFDARRLGHEPAYTHETRVDGCGIHRAREHYTTRDHTRPYDGDRGELDRREGFYLDLANGARGKTRPVDRRDGAQLVMPASPVYWEWHREPSGRRQRARITYWFFYGFSQPPGPPRVVERFSHEGDWERISLLIEPAGDQAWLPLSVRFHFHNSAVDVPWETVERVPAAGDREATHVVAYSAALSHATYSHPGAYSQGPAFAHAHDRAAWCLDCLQWRTWERLESACEQPWYGYGGAWGNIGSGFKPGDKTGPLGPSSYKVGGEPCRPDRFTREG